MSTNINNHIIQVFLLFLRFFARYFSFILFWFFLCFCFRVAGFVDEFDLLVQLCAHKCSNYTAKRYTHGTHYERIDTQGIFANYCNNLWMTWNSSSPRFRALVYPPFNISSCTRIGWEGRSLKNQSENMIYFWNSNRIFELLMKPDRGIAHFKFFHNFDFVPSKKPLSLNCWPLFAKNDIHHQVWGNRDFYLERIDTKPFHET